MGQIFNLTYESSLTNLCEINHSFDCGVLRVAYTGENRNKSYISKEAFERSIETMYNCPIVCNYDRETDSLGGHDMELVRDADGGLRIVNITEPIGCIPESAKYWWENVEEEDGSVHEYLFVEALLWKRQEAYRKIKRDGVTAHSMEISVEDGEKKDGVFHINAFEFTAFTLIGVTPCFEGSALEVFSKQDFKNQLAEMMSDLKESFNLIATSEEVNDKSEQICDTEGGERNLDEKMALLEKYNITVESLDFSIEDFSIEELTEKFEAMSQTEEPDAQPEEDGQDNFALVSNVLDEIYRAIDAVTIEREWGTCNRYWYVDCDMDAQEVYCWDTNDWLLYGFKYSVDGDAVSVDFETKARKKYAIVDFDEGEQKSPFAEMFCAMEQKLRDNAEFERKFNDASQELDSVKNELNELKQFKADIENEKAKNERAEILGKFEYLAGVESFDKLCEECMNFSVEELEEKCFAIKGRANIQEKFSLDEGKPKLSVIRHETNKTTDTKEPYNGIFAEYGID